MMSVGINNDNESGSNHDNVFLMMERNHGLFWGIVIKALILQMRKQNKLMAKWKRTSLPDEKKVATAYAPKSIGNKKVASWL